MKALPSNTIITFKGETKQIIWTDELLEEIGKMRRKDKNWDQISRKLRFPLHGDTLCQRYHARLGYLRDKGVLPALTAPSAAPASPAPLTQKAPRKKHTPQPVKRKSWIRRLLEWIDGPAC
jgi:hypothetical protein